MFYRAKQYLRRTLPFFPEYHLRTNYEKQYTEIISAAQQQGWEVQKLPYLTETGAHPESYMDFECRFAAWHLRHSPNVQSILDIGSYLRFIIGLSAQYDLTSIDVRPRTTGLAMERQLTCDAVNLTLADSAFDAVISLCAIEHFGLGRYGDKIDLHSDKYGLSEMRRVLKPGGLLILSTALTRGRPVLAFNAHRIYTLPMIRNFFEEMTPIDERYFSNRLQRECSFDEITDISGEWDVYCGCWRKPQE